MNLYKQFLALSKGKQIILAVCAVHCCVLIALLIHHVATQRLKPARPMAVKMVSIRAEPIRIELPKTTAPTAAKPSPKKTSPIKPKASPSKSTKPTEKSPEPSLLTEIAKSLDTLRSEAKHSSRPTLHVPSIIASKAETQSPSDPAYEELLISHLQTALELPEYGEVKAKLEINRFGQLVHLEILEAKSNKNSAFLKNRLPELLFPCLNDGTQSFTITFRNVEMD